MSKLTLMSGRNQTFLVDTNILVAAQRQDIAVINQLTIINTLLSVIVLGELYFGARNSANVEVNIASIDKLTKQYPLLDCDHATASYYALIKRSLRVKGNPIPENDIWIAAQTLQHGLTLITRDAHFRQVDGLTIAVW